MVGYVNGHKTDNGETHRVSLISAALPANPADCSDLQTALLLWCGKIAKDATGARGLTTLQEACADMAKRLPRFHSFRTTVIGTLLRCADDHLGDRHSAAAIDTIFLKVFPDQVADDYASNADLDATAVAIDTCSETIAEIARLAKLSSVEYDRERSGAAKRLGIRAATLDVEVKARRGGVDVKGQGRPFELPEIEPWPEALDGAALLLDITAAIRQFVVMPDGAAEIVALWILHTHCFDCFMHSPRLAITSPEKGCGKTTLLDVAARLVARPLSTSNATVSAIFRVVEMAQPTLLIDEADTFLKENDELRGILNTGHRKGGSVLRTVGDDHEPRKFSTWAPAAIAMIGRLPDTLEDRSISCSMRRRKVSERVQSFRVDRAEPLMVLAQKMARWAADHDQQLRAADPTTEGLQNRIADNWRSLLAIADAAGGTWPDRMRQIATAAVATRSEQSTRVLLLSDIQAAFKAKGTDRLSSEELTEYLTGLDERPWAEWRRGLPLAKSGLARLLTPFGILSGTIRLDNGLTLKGYYLVSFGDAFERYLDVENVTPSQPNNHGHCDVFQSATAVDVVTD